ncbi:TPA: hypothetical protein P6O31_002454 [Staphylococcus aureus]|nr:hypothetical protein [Staphylococcus aureus]HDP4181209.1 hypothetical protein [Staphylococcus aureus]HDR2094545.1 hypothetical protein [Staphylococcus aureus]
MSITKQIILTPPENFSFRNYLFLLCCEATATSRYVEVARVQAIKVFRLAVWPQIKSFCPLQNHVGLLKAQSLIVRVSVSTQKNKFLKNGNKGKVNPHFPSIFEFHF